MVVVESGGCHSGGFTAAPAMEGGMRGAVGADAEMFVAVGTPPA
jgi:hypothetical protein